MAKNESLSVIKKNLQHIFRDDLATCERMNAVLDEVARLSAADLVLMLQEGRFSAEELQREPPAGMLAFSSSLFAETPLSNLSLARVKLTADRCAYLAAFVAQMTAELAHAGMHPSPTLFLARTARIAAGQVAVPETNAFKRALIALLPPESGFSPAYVGSFADACEAVVGGDCVYCILPLENSRDGFLSTTLRMIGENGLFITRICEMADESGMVTRFALLCRDGGAWTDSVRPQIALRVAQIDAEALSLAFAAMALLGVTPLRAVSLPLPYTDGYAQYCIFDGTTEALFSWLFLLTTTRRNYTLLGVYDTVTPNEINSNHI